ncbi:MAG: acylphosphatase [Proteobacteria bacterium]|nr:acylphosphatase [Pseudomonadota bacterium]
MEAAFFLVSGRVQGVGFRASARHEALALGLSGYAHNRPDGKVEVFVQGPAPVIDTFARWIGYGPPLAKVEHVLRQRAQPREAAGFGVG